MLDTGLVTETFLTVLAGCGEAVGDAVKPEDCGWLTGDPNSGVFRPYTVVAFAGAQLRDQPQSYAEQIRSWQSTWRLSHYGATRGQADMVAGRMRAQVTSALNVLAGDYKITGARWQGLGPMTRDDSFNPALWSASDSLILMLDA